MFKNLENLSNDLKSSNILPKNPKMQGKKKKLEYIRN